MTMTPPAAEQKPFVGASSRGVHADVARPSWVSTEEQPVSFVELFFDLVFVFAFTRITGLARADLTWTGVGHALLILWLVWWAWTQFTWVLNPAHTGRTGVRLFTLAATSVAFFMAQAVSDAFGEGAFMFACAYALGRLIGLVLFFKVSTDAENRSAIRTFGALSLSGIAAVLAGGLLGGSWQTVLWSAAVLADFVTVLRAGSGTWTVHPRHFAERHGLIVMIVLGESLIAAGVGLEDVDRDLTFLTVSSAAVALVCALWWTYFGAVKEELEDALAATPRAARGRLARDAYSLAHFPIVAGVIGIAVALEEAVAHPTHALPTEIGGALSTGLLLYTCGIAYALWRAHSCAVWHWLAAALIGALLVPVAGSQLPSLVLLTVTATLVVLAVLERPAARTSGAR